MPSPVPAVVAEHEVTGLLSSELEAVGLEGVAHIAVPDGGLDDADASRPSSA